jgi:transcriptional regulator with XRE-family HTH domain
MRIEEIVSVFIEKHQQQGKSIARIAKETGVNSNTLNNWKYNKSIPSLPDALKMAKWLGVELDAPEMILGHFQPRSAVEVIKSLEEDKAALKDAILLSLNTIQGYQSAMMELLRSVREEVLYTKVFLSGQPVDLGVSEEGRRQGRTPKQSGKGKSKK